VVDQDAPHRGRGYGEEVSAVPDRLRRALVQAKKRFMNQRSRLQQVTGPFVSEIALGEAAKLPVHDRHQFIAGRLVAATPAFEETRNVPGLISQRGRSLRHHYPDPVFFLQ
jgi:hypothetical protein